MVHPRPHHPAFPSRTGWKDCVYPLLIAAFVFFIASPMIGLGIDLLSAAAKGTPALLTPLVLSPRRLWLLLASCGYAAAVASCCLAAGVLLVSFLWQQSRTVMVAVLLLLLAVSAIPPYIHALTWSAVAGDIARHLPGIPLSGWGISFWVGFMAFLPPAALLAWIAFASVDPALVEAARVLRPDTDVLVRILLPLAAPALGAAFGLIFLICCSDYSIPSLFGADNYSLDIFAWFSISASPASALLYALPLMLVTILVLFACRLGIRTLAMSPGWLSSWSGTPPQFPRIVSALQLLVCLLFVIHIVILVFGLVTATGSVSTFLHAIATARNEVSYSILIALGVIFISLPLSLTVAYELKQGGLRGSIAWLLVLLPLALPASLIGIGMATFWSSAAPAALSMGPLLPVFAGIARFAPVAAIILFVQLRFIDPDLFDAADIFSPGIIQNWTGIRLPLLIPGLIVAAVFLFILTLAELGATLIVSPPGHATLTMRIYNYLHYGAAGDVAGLCLMIAIGTLSAGMLVAAFLYSRYSRQTNRATDEGD